MSEPSIPKSLILVIDDEQEHAQVMCEALSRQGHRCDVTFSLAEAESRLSRKKYDVIVTDLMMDGRRDGLEVLHKTRDMIPPAPRGAGHRPRRHSHLQAGVERRGV